MIEGIDLNPSEHPAWLEEANGDITYIKNEFKTFNGI